jgi:spore germination protein
MIIHVVQPEETIYSIANTYGVSVTRLIQDNELINSSQLVPGQTIVILTPVQTYIVQNGDSLMSIARSFNVSLEQLIRNNPYLSDREFIYIGETIVISYEQQGQIFTNGYIIPFANNEILRKTLPFLTYLTIFNYRATNVGEIQTYYNDIPIINLAKLYSVAPIMMLTTITTQGETNLQVAYELLLNVDYQNNLIENVLTILKTKGFYGLNLSFQYVNISNIQLYNNLLSNISSRLKSEGYPVYVTLAPNFKLQNDVLTFEKVDYTTIGQLADNITILQFTWSSSTSPPAPVSSILHLKEFLDYITTLVPPEKIDLGQSVIGYDWELPYNPGFSRARSLNYDSSILLARDIDATIQFDELSQSPYFEYEDILAGLPVKHIVWFVDARSIHALVNLITEYKLRGITVWNIMHFYAQLWLVVNSQYEIETEIDFSI